MDLKLGFKPLRDFDRNTSNGFRSEKGSPDDSHALLQQRLSKRPGHIAFDGCAASLERHIQ
jgi:hypothetical protein